MKTSILPTFNPPKQHESRGGATAVEFALVALALFLTVFAGIETGRRAMVQHKLNEAARVAAREASLPTISSASTVESNLRERLSSSISTAGSRNTVSVTVTPRDLSAASSGDPVRVQVAMNYSEVSWIPTNALRSLACSSTLSAEATLERE